MDNEVIHLSHLKNTARKKAKNSGNPTHWDAYKKINNNLKNVINKKYNQFLSDALNDIDVHLKRFWHLMGTKGHKNIPDEIIYNGVNTTDPNIKTNLFNQFFHDSFNDSNYTILPGYHTFVINNLSYL